MIKSRGPNIIEIVSVELKNFMPSPTGKVIATYKNIEEMLAVGCGQLVHVQHSWFNVSG